MSEAIGIRMKAAWERMRPSLLPFADVGTVELPLGRILRLSLFQVSVGMALVLVTGTLNRVMIVELGVPAWFVALMIALPVIFAPLRALIGFRSDNHDSAFGWRRVPFIWVGTLLQWGGLAIMPFALLVLSGTGVGPVIYGQIGAGLAFILVGAGIHTTQTAGLALASDLARPDLRPRVVALLFVMLLIGMFVSALVFGWLLRDYHPIRLIRVVQSAAVVTLFLNVISLWKQEPRDLARPSEAYQRSSFSTAWRQLKADPARIPDAGRPRARHGRIHDAGHSARAVRRPDPWAVRQFNDGSHGIARGRHARSVRTFRQAP